MPPAHRFAKDLRSTHAVDAPAPADRRTFVRSVGLAVLTVQCLPILSCAADPSSPASEDARDSMKILSSPGKFGHVHDLLIPLTLLCAPPAEGVALTTSNWSSGMPTCEAAVRTRPYWP